MKTIVLTALLTIGALVAAAFVFFYAGGFDIAADVPHWGITARVMEAVRSRSLEVHSKDVRAPPGDDAALIASGAEHYAAMCSGCHLAPDKKESEIRAGLYPKPPDLTKPTQLSNAESFWIIKHGIKMSGMPAWGVTHDDQSIWGLVAFMRKLPELTPVQYRALLDKEAHAHHSHAHSHPDSESSPSAPPHDAQHHHP